MRKLMWFTLGFGGSCALCAYLLPGDRLWIFALAAGFLAAGLLAFGRSFLLFKRLVVVFLGISLGLGWFAAYGVYRLEPVRDMDGLYLKRELLVTDYSYETDYGCAADVTVNLDGKSYSARVYLNEKKELEPGDTVEGIFRFRTTLPGGNGPATYHKGRGMFLLLYQKGDLHFARSEHATWRVEIARMRQVLRNRLRECFPEDTFPFAQALLLGDTEDLSYEVDTAFQVSGIRHVVAVSGLHVSILFALLSAVTFKKRFLTVLVGFPLLFLFAALAGFTPSVTRACLMWSLTLLALLFDRNYDSATALSFAALVMLIGNPMVITDVGFQLSVGSVTGIYLFAGKIQKWMWGLFGDLRGNRARGFFARWLVTSVSVSLSAMAMTTPLSALYFGTVSLVGVVTNLLTLWVISFIFYGIIAVCLLSFFWQAGAGALAWITAWPIRYVLAVSGTLARFPLAAVYTASPYIMAWLVFVYVLLGVFLLRKEKQPGLLGACALFGLCAALLASWGEPMRDDVRFTMLDVGQGQCLLLQSEGRNFLIDCGGDSDTETADIAAEALLSQGIPKLDGVILTHWDRDHAGAVNNLLSRVDADILILPEEYHEDELRTKGRRLYASQALELAFGDAKLRIFPPVYPGNGNEKSLCVLFDSQMCDILITGDRNGFGERSLLRNAEIPKVDILVAGHHGSRDSTCEELLATVQPEIVCISVGEGNSYGHPAPELLHRLNQFGCEVYRTDIHGEILIRR